MTTPSAQDYLDGAHQRTVWFVVRVIAALAILLYALAGFIVVMNGKNAVPGELWQAAASAAGLIGGLLISTRTQSSTTASVTVPLSPVLNSTSVGPATPDVSAAELADDSFPAGPTDAPDDDTAA
jgi:amino acid permease